MRDAWPSSCRSASRHSFNDVHPRAIPTDFALPDLAKLLYGDNRRQKFALSQRALVSVLSGHAWLALHLQE